MKPPRGSDMACLVMGLLALSCGSSDATAPATSTPADTPPLPTVPEPPPLDWTPCTEPDLPDTECALLKVPLDYEHPDGEMIDVALSRVKAADPAKRIGILLLDGGGPGLSSRFLAPTIRDSAAKGPPFPYSNPGTPEVAARFDLIGIDPRGVGASRPALDCQPGPAYRTVDFTPDDASELQALEDTVREIAETCAATHGRFLEFVDSYSVARDMDQIRRALGEEKLSYFGTSYGSVMGAAYADLFPERVRAMAIDSAVTPNLDGPTFMRERAQNSERAFDAYAAECDADAECSARFGGDLRATYDRAMAQLTTEPLVDPTTGEALNDSVPGFIIGEFIGRFPGRAPVVDSLVDALARRDGTGQSSTLNFMRGDSVFVPLNCADLDLPDPSDVFGTLLPELLQANPRFGNGPFPSFLPCAYWPSSPRKHPSPHAKGAPPILVIGGTGDGAVPYQWSVELAAALDSGVLLTRDGVGHIAFSQCVVDTVSTYLVDLEVPAEGTVCPAP